MSEKIKFTASPLLMGARIENVPGFEGDVFNVNFPESIGSTNKSRWFDIIECSWTKLEDGNWLGKGWVKNEIEYTIEVSIHSDYVDFVLSLTNKSEEKWEETHAFNCVNCGSAGSLRDHECKRHWVRSNGEFQKLIEIPRVFGPRPALQLYSVEGAPAGKEILFVHAFHSTPEDLTIEGWMAIESTDGKHLVAVVSKPALYTFQNREYSCIHSAPSFGPLGPDETGTALTRIYFVQSSLKAWYNRMTREMQGIDL